MSGFFTSSDGAASLSSEIHQGVDDSFDVYGTDRTTIRVDWIEDFKRDIKKLSRRPTTPSMTEIEMVMAREAHRAAGGFLSDTCLNWVYAIDDLKFSCERRTVHRQDAKTIMKRTKGSMPQVSSGGIDEHEYRMYILKKDIRSLENTSSDMGMDKKERLKLGNSILVLANEDMFSMGTIREARDVESNVETQIKGIKGVAEQMMVQMGKRIGEALKDDCIYEEELNKAISGMVERQPEALEVFVEGLEDTGIHPKDIGMGDFLNGD